MKNKVIFLMGVSWCWKRTVAENLLLSDDIVSVNTTTTRPMRPWEKQWDKYDYVDDERFQYLIDHDDFIEYALVHQSYFYWTRKSLVEEAFDSGKHVIKEIEIYGWEKIVANPWVRDYCYSIFMNISDQKMMRRILDRNPDTTQKELENRLKSAPYEREQAKLLCDNYVEVEYMSRTEQARYVKKLIADLVQNKSTKEEQ